MKNKNKEKKKFFLNQDLNPVHQKCLLEKNAKILTIYKKRFSVSQLDVVKNQNWVDEMNADEKFYIELPTDLLEHFFKGPFIPKV